MLVLCALIVSVFFFSSFVRTYIIYIFQMRQQRFEGPWWQFDLKCNSFNLNARIVYLIAVVRCSECAVGLLGLCAVFYFCVVAFFRFSFFWFFVFSEFCVSFCLDSCSFVWFLFATIYLFDMFFVSSFNVILRGLRVACDMSRNKKRIYTLLFCSLDMDVVDFCLISVLS